MRYAKFENRDPFRHVPFDDGNDLPSVSEVIGWTVLAGMFASLCYGFLGL